MQAKLAAAVGRLSHLAAARAFSQWAGCLDEARQRKERVEAVVRKLMNKCV